MGSAGALSASARGSAVFASATLLRVGGVLFQGEISNLDFVKEIDTVNLVQDDDDSWWLQFATDDDQSYYYWAPNWVYAPAIQFALGDDTAVASLFGEPSDDEWYKISPTAKIHDDMIDVYYRCSENPENAHNVDECVQLTRMSDGNPDELIEKWSQEADAEISEYMQYYFFADIHESMHNTGLGLRMLQADSLLMGSSYLEKISVEGKLADFPDELSAETPPASG